MLWTITRFRIDCLDTGCVSICPVDCIYEYVGDNREHFPNQLYINPGECIDRSAYECPWQGIYEEPAVPGLFASDIAQTRNAVL
jgi:ferredoxin